MLVSPVEPYHKTEYKYKNATALRNHRIEHGNAPICAHCGNIIEMCGFSNDRDIIKGFRTEYRTYMHYVCYDEVQQELALRLYGKEDGIVLDMDQAILLDQITPYIYYSAYGQYGNTEEDGTTYKYCSYCEKQLDTMTQLGVCYPSSNEKARDFFGLQYIHTACYNYIRTKPRYTGNGAWKPNKDEEEEEAK